MEKNELLETLKHISDVYFQKKDYISAGQINKAMDVIEDCDVVKNNIVLPDVSGRSELLFAFIAEVKKEFADQNWDYLDFIAERVLKANNSH